MNQTFQNLPQGPAESMAENGAKGDSFEGRVKRLFGASLFGEVPTASFPDSSWSVAAGNVERSRWARPSEARDAEDAGAERADTPCSTAFYDSNGCLKKRGRRRRSEYDFEGEFEEEEEEEEEEKEEEDRVKHEEEGGGDDVEGIRVSIGLDPTLDREEEEDKYDREAMGRDGAADRVYMKSVMDHGPNLSIHTAVPDLFDDSSEANDHFCRDHPVDSTGAVGRLREEDELTNKSLHFPTQTQTKTQEEPPPASKVRKPQGDVNLKPILKRKVEQEDAKPKKRVRFDSTIEEDQAELPGHDEDSPVVPHAMDVGTEKENSSFPVESLDVPDYVRNPSKYTCYTLDTPDCDDKSNKRALADLHNILRSDPNRQQFEMPVELPSSVTFIPRKKAVDNMAVDECPKSGNAKSSFIGVAAGGPSDETDHCDMDEDDDGASRPHVLTNSRMHARRYRSSTSDDST